VTDARSAELLTKINKAVAEANEAEKKLHAELVSRSKAVGLLLLEAKKLHPAVADFQAFLKRVDGLQLSRAYDMMRIAGGRATEEQIKKDARERQKKSRAKKKQPKPEPISVTHPHVTESPKRKPEQKVFDSPQKAHDQSARALAEFTLACRTWLPRISADADRKKAFVFVSDWFHSRPGTSEAEAA
jgi:hypothetical protein